MKRYMITTIILCAFAVSGAFGQQDKLVNLKAYQDAKGKLTDAQRQKIGEARNSFKEAYPNFWIMVETLGGKEDSLDTPLENTLVTYYYHGAESFPAREAILPHNNPKLADQKLGAAVFQEIQILRFLGNTEAVSRHEAVLKFITDRKNVTRQEIETFYKGGIRGLVSEVVDKQVAENQPTNPETITEIKQIMTNFFLNPTRENHNMLYQKQRQYSSTDADRGRNAHTVLVMSIAEFSLALGDTVLDPKMLAPR